MTDDLLVAQDEARAILHSRAGDHWETRLISGMDSCVHLPSVDVTLALSDVFALIDFPEEGAAG